MLRVSDHLVGRALLDDPAEVHDGDPVGVVRGRGEVVRDHQDREPVVPELVEDREDPRPHRHVEHRDGLVRDEELGVEDEARRDRDALTLAPRELVRIAVDVEVGGVRPASSSARLTSSRRSSFEPMPVHLERLLDRRADAEARVERLVRDPGR